MTSLVSLTLRRNAALYPRFATLVHTRGVATSVSNRPASQTLAQAAVNIKEESKNATSSVAKLISGAGTQGQSFVETTKLTAAEVPKPIMVLGLAGGLPYLGAGATTVYFAHQASLAANGFSTGIDPGAAITILDQALNFQVTYGAVMLSSLGALHFGMEIAGYGGHQGYRRLMLGVAPMIFAWPTLGLQPVTALVVQWIGFTSLWAADSRATSLGWTPKWFAQYRFYLSILAGTCILGSLAGTSYWGPVGGHGLVTHDLEETRAERAKIARKAGPAGTLLGANGPVQTAAPKETDGAFVRIEKRPEQKQSVEKGQ